MGGSQCSDEHTSKIRASSKYSMEVERIQRKGSKLQRMGRKLSRGEVMVYSQLYGMEKATFSENEGHNFVKHILK